MYLLYSALLAVGLLVSLPYWMFGKRRHGKYRDGLSERLGRVPATALEPQSEPAIWVHAVSVGEVLAVSELVEELRRRFPEYRVVVSTTTDTGQKLAKQHISETKTSSTFRWISHLPFDRIWRRCGLELIVLAETEFWPNFLRLAHASGARVAVVNARISDRSWPGYRRLRRILKGVLQQVDLFLAQTAEDASRLSDIGAPAERVQVSGNLKFDVSGARGAGDCRQPAVDVPAGRRRSRSSFAAARWKAKKQLLLRAFENVLASHPRAVMILAPRHPERFAGSRAAAGTAWHPVLAAFAVERRCHRGRCFAGRYHWRTRRAVRAG